MDTETMEGGFDENEFSDLDHDVNEVSKDIVEVFTTIDANLTALPP